MLTSALSAARLGTLGFTIGTLAWALVDVRSDGAVDVACALYLVGCVFLVDDAFFQRSRVLARVQRVVRLDSYRTSSLSYAAGTVAWGAQAWRAAHVVDAAALLYLVGCAFFVADSFRLAALPLATGARLSTQQAGVVAFVLGTVAWAFSSGFSVPVAAYGLGCLFFARDAFRASTKAAKVPA